MYASRLRIAALAAVAAAGLAACTTPYGYGGVSVGAGSGYYGSNYGYGYGGGYPGYGYGYDAGYPGYGLGYAPYWGWNDNFYYPGTGYYVYDIYRRPHRWSDAQRRYWRERLERARRSDGQRVVIRDNWDDFRRDRSTVRPNRVDRDNDRGVRVERSGRPVRVERGDRPERVDRGIVRTERSSTAATRAERRSEARAARSSEKGSDKSTGRRGRGINKD